MHITILENIKDISKKNEYIKKYNLKFIDQYKCYKIYNTYITSNSKCINFEKHIYKNVDEYYIKNIMPFSFYDVHDEFVYDKYMNDNYILKHYKNYIILELINK